MNEPPNVTRGPWNPLMSNDGEGWQVEGEGGSEVALLYYAELVDGRIYYTRLDDDEANAHLLAAAPKMFDAIEDAIRFFEVHLRKFNIAASFLSAEDIAAMNDVPLKLMAARRKALGE